MKAIEPERLQIRAFVMDHLEDIHRIVADPQVAWIGSEASPLEHMWPWMKQRAGLGSLKRRDRWG